MKNIKLELKFFKKQHKFKHEGVLISPRKHWNFILAVLAILIASSFVFGFYVFIQEGQEPASAGAGQNQYRHKINLDKLNKTLDVFAEKEKVSQDIISAVAEIPDPGL